MKFIFVSLLFIAFVSQSWAATNNNMCVNPDPEIKGGDSIPWPWGSEIGFPWTRIQGVWGPTNQECGSFFSFTKSPALRDGTRFVRIVQYDPASCVKIAEGTGYEYERVIYASMAAGRQSYDLTIRAFDSSILQTKTRAPGYDFDLTQGYIAAKPSSVVVVSLYPKKNWELNASYRLEKIQSTPNLICHDF